MPDPFRRSVINRFNKSLHVGLLSFTLFITAFAQSAFVRVNQVGYGSGQTKRAYLMSSGAETGATFAVKNSGGVTVFSGPIGANLGSWSRSFGNVYALDFDTVTAAGTYTISVTDPTNATSPPF